MKQRLPTYKAGKSAQKRLHKTEAEQALAFLECLKST